MYNKRKRYNYFYQFDEAFDYAKNLFNHALLFTINSDCGRHFMANTMCYSRLIPELNNNDSTQYDLNLYSFDLESSQNNNELSENERELLKLWRNLKTNVLQRAKSHNVEKLPSLKQKFVENANFFHAQIERQLQTAFLTEHTKLYKASSFFKQTTVHPDTQFIDLVKHALEHDSRTRQVFINLGWMDNELQLTLGFYALIKGTLLEKNLPFKNLELVTVTYSS